jgi:hypothetical protein
MAAGPRRETIEHVLRMRKGSCMLEWKARLLTLLVVFVSAAGEYTNSYNWNW